MLPRSGKDTRRAEVTHGSVARPDSVAHFLGEKEVVVILEGWVSDALQEKQDSTHQRRASDHRVHCGVAVAVSF